MIVLETKHQTLPSRKLESVIKLVSALMGEYDKAAPSILGCFFDPTEGSAKDAESLIKAQNLAFFKLWVKHIRKWYTDLPPLAIVRGKGITSDSPLRQTYVGRKSSSTRRRYMR